jgi:3-oxoadipate enol-lactonase
VELGGCCRSFHGRVRFAACYGPEAPRQWEERAEKALKEGLQALVGFQQTRWFNDAFQAEHPEIVRESVCVFLKNDVQAYAETCRMLGAVDLRSTLSKIDVPTRIAVGEDDYATPLDMAEALHAGIPGSTLTVIEKGRHLTPLEQPDRIAAELKQLLDIAQ